MAVGGAGGGGGGGAGNIRAGGASVEIGANTGPLQASLNRAKGMIAGFGKMISGLPGGVLAGVGVGMGFGKLKETMTHAVDYAADMGKLGKVLGTSTEEASKLAYAFRTVGIDGEELTHLGVHLQRTLVEAAQNGSQLFTDLGIDAKDLFGKPFEVQMQAVADAIMSIRNPALQMDTAMDIFGKKGFDAVKMFRKGLGEAKQEAVDMGFVVTGKMAQQAVDAKKSMRLLGEVFEATFLSIGLAMLPPKETLKGFVDEVKAAGEQVRQFIGTNRIAILVLGKAGLVVLGASAALLVLSKTLGMVGAALSIALIPLKLGLALVLSLVSALPLLLSPLGLIAAAIAACGVVFLTMTDSGARFRDRMADLFGNIAATAKDAWGGIVAAIKAGDLELAFEIGAKALQVIWLELIGALEREWNNFKDGWMKGLSEMVIAAKAALLAMAGKDKNDIMGAVAGGYLGFKVGRMFGPVGMVIGTAIGAAGGVLIEEIAAAEEKLEAEMKARGLKKPDNVGNIGGAQNELDRKKKELQDLIEKARRLNQPPPGVPGAGEVIRPGDFRNLMLGGIPIGRIMEASGEAAELKKHAAARMVAPIISDAAKGGFGVRAGQFDYGDTVQKASLIAQEKANNIAADNGKKLDGIRAAVEAWSGVKFK